MMKIQTYQRAFNFLWKNTTSFISIDIIAIITKNLQKKKDKNDQICQFNKTLTSESLVIFFTATTAMMKPRTG